ncbi:MAG: ATP-binding cassette domain-containing protein [Vicingaceae bacterium]
MENILEVSQLSKKFGKKQAVDHISFQVGRGQIFGLLGPNGSGKSTTLGMILTLLNRDSGEVTLFGQKDLEQAVKQLGVLLESASYYPSLTGKQNLKISCQIKGVDPAEIPTVMEKVGLADELNEKVKNYSLGMKQRLSVASVLLGKPEMMVFDEPTNGLDPQGIADMRNLLLDLAKEGKTILIASHLLNEMEKICSHVAILKKGKIIEQGVLKEITQGHDDLESYFLKLTA